ncbi:MAG: YncE family protein [Bryobacteraceae bacterium]|jgi:outer membrane protein assembly factor BamB
METLAARGDSGTDRPNRNNLQVRSEAMLLTNSFARGFIPMAFLAFQAPGAVRTIIPNGGAGHGSLSVINPATGTIERSLATATSSGPIINSTFAITKTGGSAAVLAYSPSAYLLSVVNLSTGKITAQQELSVPPPPAPAVLAANPKTSFLYLTYQDSSHNTHLWKIDAATLSVVLDSNLGGNAGLTMSVSPDGETIYLTGYGYPEVAAVKASNLKLIGTVPLSDAWDAVVSPDSSTLYVADGEYPGIALTYVDAATLKVTQKAPLDNVSVVFGLAISPDGAQLYMPGQANYQGTDIFTIDVATQALMAVPLVVTGNIAVSPAGTVYVGDGSDVVVFDPASQSVMATFPAFSNGTLALNSTGSEIYFLNEFSSTLADTGAPPSLTVVATAVTGYLSSAAYDATDHLLLAADNANNIEVLDAGTLQPAGQIFVPNLAYAFLNAGGGSGFATSSTPQVFRFDPVSLEVTGTASIPSRDGDTNFNYSQPVLSGSTLYVPFQFVEELITRGAGTLSAGSPPSTGIAAIDTVQMTVTATWPFKGLPLIGSSPGGQVVYAVVPEAGQVLDLDQIDPSTGKIVRHAQIPGLNTSGIYSNPAVSPDGGTIYFSNNNTLYTFNAKTLALTNTVAGIGLVNLAVSPGSDYLYGATPPPCYGCAIEYSLQVVSTSSLSVAGSTPTAYQAGPALFLGN